MIVFKFVRCVIDFISFAVLIDDCSLHRKWDISRKFVGVMAQDLINTQYEDAVYKNEQGYYMVDYSKLPVEMKEV